MKNFHIKNIIIFILSTLGILCLSSLYPAFAADVSYDISAETLFSLLFFGLLIGIVFSATAYLFFVWVVMRDKGQVFMVLFLLSLGIRIFASNDILME